MQRPVTAWCERVCNLPFWTRRNHCNCIYILVYHACESCSAGAAWSSLHVYSISACRQLWPAVARHVCILADCFTFASAGRTLGPRMPGQRPFLAALPPASGFRVTARTAASSCRPKASRVKESSTCCRAAAPIRAAVPASCVRVACASVHAGAHV